MVRDVVSQWTLQQKYLHMQIKKMGIVNNNEEQILIWPWPIWAYFTWYWLKWTDLKGDPYVSATTVADIAVPYSLKVNEGIQGFINFVTFYFNQQKQSHT